MTPAAQIAQKEPKDDRFFREDEQKESKFQEIKRMARFLLTVSKT
jgi:hypothetical protein